jgi:hypothetical protein
VIIISLALAGRASGQTASTGALTGVALDPSGAVLPGVVVRLVNQRTTEIQSAASDEEGRFAFLSLLPGRYELQAIKPDFEQANFPEINIYVTETLRVELHLRLLARSDSAHVSSEPLMFQTDNAALGRVVNETAVGGLPLATRNFTQIAGLSPGVVVGVFNAGELGLGGTAL